MFILWVNTSPTSIVQNRSTMRTPQAKSKRKQTIPQAAIKRHGFFATALGSLLLFVTIAAPALAVDAVWNCCPPSNDWNTGGNWTPAMAPVNPGDTATFNSSSSSSTTFLVLSGDVKIDSMTFDLGASAFTINTGFVAGYSFSFVGVGIVNKSLQTQTIINDSGSSTNFLKSSSAGNATIMNANSGSGAGTTEFHNFSTADHATITNDGFGTSTKFFQSSSAGNATIMNANSGSGAGTTEFHDFSTADHATITNSGGGGTEFHDNSTAGNATITNSGGFTDFLDTSSAGNATITNSGGGSTDFLNTSSAGNATLIANGGTILFEQDSTGGTARVEVFGNGNLDISSHNAPGVTVGSIEGSGDVFLGANNLTVGSNNLSTLFSGVISGLGGLTKVGTGTLILSGENTYTGPTIADAGSLLVDGSIGAGPTSVNAGGLLGGHGTIGGNVLNSGVVSPGDSPGTLTVFGNYTQTPGGTLRIEIAGTAPGQFDLLAVGGHASLAGTLQLIRLGNFQLQVGDKITFLTAQGGVSGTFSTIQNPFVTNTLIKAEINILANAVQLEGTQGSFTEVACNPNTLAVANALDSAVGDPRAAGLIEFLDTQPLSELCAELELISPEELAAMFNIGVSLANIQSVNLERRMEDIRAGSSGFSARGFSIDSRVPEFSPGLAGPTGPEGKSGPSVMQPTPENRWGVFVTGLGEFTDVDDTSIAPGYNFSTGGLTFGVDYRVSPNFAIGLTGGYAHTNADLVNNGSLDVNGGTIGAYATGFAGGFYVDAAAFGVFNGYDSHRTALLGTASGDTDGQDFNALVVAGYDWKSGGLTIGPLASFQYTYVEFDSFTEHGSLAPLSFSNQNAESTRTALGAKASYDWHVGHVVVKPEIRASWQHEFGDRDYSIVSRFANGAGNGFTVNGPAIGRDSLLIGAGAAVLLNDRVSVYAYYDGELARTNYTSNNVSAGFRVTF
jgi:outer membrane autotransporter protein